MNARKSVVLLGDGWEIELRIVGRTTHRRPDVRRIREMRWGEIVSRVMQYQTPCVDIDSLNLREEWATQPAARRYARLALAYQALLETGELEPNRRLAEIMGCTYRAATSRVARAVERGYLNPSDRLMMADGATPKAWEDAVS